MSEDTHLSVLTMSSHEYEAQLIVDALQEQGIHAEKSGGPASDFKVGVPGQVKILVETSQLIEATAALDTLRDEADHIDWSKIDVGKPQD